MTAFENAKRHRDHLEFLVSASAARLKAIPGVGSGHCGLTPDSVKATPAYQMARADYARRFRDLRLFNKAFVSTFKTELRADRRSSSR